MYWGPLSYGNYPGCFLRIPNCRIVKAPFSQFRVCRLPAIIAKVLRVTVVIVSVILPYPLCCLKRE